MEPSGREGQRLWFKGGRTGSLAAARWNAERVARRLLANRHRVTSPQNGERRTANGERLILPG